MIRCSSLLVKPANNSLCCSICFNLFKDPVCAPRCGHEFCRTCLETCHVVKKECPLCRGTLLDEDIMIPNPALEAVIMSLNMHCPFHVSGCVFETKVMHMDAHCQSCPYKQTSCPHLHLGCEWVGPENSVKMHLTDQCKYTKIKDVFSQISDNNKTLHNYSNQFKETIFKCLQVLQVQRSQQTRQENIISPPPPLLPPLQNGDIVFVAVIVDGATEYFFESLPTHKISQLINPLKRQICECHHLSKVEIVVTCDAPLEFDGLLLDESKTFIDYGLYPTSNWNNSFISEEHDVIDVLQKFDQHQLHEFNFFHTKPIRDPVKHFIQRTPSATFSIKLYASLLTTTEIK